MEEDDKLIAELRNTSYDSEIEGYEYSGGVEKKPEPVTKNGYLTYPPNRRISLNALAHAHYCCEIDHRHPTFISKSSGKPYMEPHHLVPRAFQEQIDAKIDREENIVSLCSNCHNEIHYGRDAQNLIEILYEKRKNLLRSVGINISLQELLEMYK